MRLKLSDDCVDEECLVGPMPNFGDTFESFLLPKAVELLLIGGQHQSLHDNTIKYVSLMSPSADLTWMREIQLSTSCREQNIEIIYNDNKIYFKTTKKIQRDTLLSAFPSKDLEIALGLQYIPLSNDDNYTCKKCLQSFNFQYALMIHSRYFCSFNPNNFVRSLLLKTSLIKENSDPDVSLATAKRKQQYTPTVSLEQHGLNKRFKTSSLDSPAHYSQSGWPFQTMVNSLHHHSVYPVVNQVSSVIETKSNSLFQNMMSSSATRGEHPMNGLMANKEQLVSFLFAYMQKQESLFTRKLNTSFISNDEAAKTPTVQSNPFLTDSSPSARFNSSSVVREPHSPLTGTPLSRAGAVSELLLNKQPIVQNWCAKCSIGFKLTTDLVNHMRTFHKKDSSSSTTHDNKSSPLVKLFDPDLNGLMVAATAAATTTSNSSSSSINGAARSTSDVKSLRCDICNEVFKEKHHLSRHMTSHR